VLQELEDGAAPSLRAGILSGLGLDEAYGRTKSDGTEREYVTDRLGSTIALSDASGTLVTNYCYEPYGQATLTGSSDGNARTFTGRDDDDTQLLYFRARYYDPASGRFISEDPLGIRSGDPNLYAYAMGDPVDLIDPDGLKPGDMFTGQWARNQAAIDALAWINPDSKKKNWEYGGMSCRDNSTGAYFATTPVTDKSKDSCTTTKSPCPPGSTSVADYHTHGAYDPMYDSERFSDKDTRDNDFRKLDGYLGTPSDVFKVYYYLTGKNRQVWPQ